MKKLKVIATKLNVRKEPSTDAEVLTKIDGGKIVDFLKPSEDELWSFVQFDGKEGWCYNKYLIVADMPDTIESKILEIVKTSNCTNIYWKDRGRAPLAFYNGMALMFARMMCKLKKNVLYAAQASKAIDGNRRDALQHYADIFNSQQLYNEADGISTLRHLFVLLIGLGMRESSGKYCCGRDTSAENIQSETAEAGLFQTSYNAIGTNAFMRDIYDEYKNSPESNKNLLFYFSKNVTCSAGNEKNFGDGEGRVFQELSKNRPDFATELAALSVRNNCFHYGPLKNKHVEIKIECNTMLLKIQNFIESNNIQDV